MNQASRQAYLFGILFLGLAVLFGAFGAHALKHFVAPDKLVTFETGVRYQFTHGFALLAIGFFQHLYPQVRLGATFMCFLVGIILFSFNCYFYALSGLKVFAMLVPVGGVLFMGGWILMGVNVSKLR